MQVEISKRAKLFLEAQAERAVTIDVTLRFCGGLVTKDAIAFTGEPPREAGFNLLSHDGLSLYWRQRFDIENADPVISDKVSPKRLHLTMAGSSMAAEASY